MAERSARDSKARDDEFNAYLEQTMGSSAGSADELAKLADLKAKGVISGAEFELQKSKLLS